MKFVFVLIGLLLVAPGFVRDGSSATTNQAISNINGDEYYPSSCGSTSPPSWCAGSDIGAWINAYIASHGPVGKLIIPRGIYSFSTPIRISQVANQMLNIECTGRSSVLRYTGSEQAIRLTASGDPSFQTQINNCTFDGSNASSGTNGIYATDYQNLHLTNVRVQDFPAANVLLHGVIGSLIIGSDLVGAGTYNFEIQPDVDMQFGSTRNLMYGGSLQYAGEGNFWDAGVSGYYGGDTGDILNGVTFESLGNVPHFIIEGTWNDAIENCYLEYFAHTSTGDLFQGWVGNYAGSGVGSNTTQTAVNFLFENNTLITPRAEQGSTTTSLFVANSTGLLALNITDTGAPTFGLSFYPGGANLNVRTSGLAIGWQAGQYQNAPLNGQLEQSGGQSVSGNQYQYGPNGVTVGGLRVQDQVVNGATLRVPLTVQGGNLNSDGMNPSISAQMVDVDTVLGNALSTRHGVLQVYSGGAESLGTDHYNLDVQPYGGTTQIGQNGTPFTTIITAAAQLTWGMIAPQSGAQQNIPIPNASASNFGVNCAPQGDVGNGSFVWSAQIYPAGNAVVHIINPTKDALTPNTAVWGCSVIQ